MSVMGDLVASFGYFLDMVSTLWSSGQLMGLRLSNGIH